jgi:hypothetical protein
MYDVQVLGLASKPALKAYDRGIRQEVPRRGEPVTRRRGGGDRGRRREARGPAAARRSDLRAGREEGAVVDVPVCRQIAAGRRRRIEVVVAAAVVRLRDRAADARAIACAARASSTSHMTSAPCQQRP